MRKDKIHIFLAFELIKKIQIQIKINICDEMLQNIKQINYN